MRSKRITVIIVVFALGLVGVLWAVAHANEKLPEGSLVGFVLAPGTAATIGEEATILFISSSEGEHAVGDCGSGPLQSVMVLNPRDPASRLNVIVTNFEAADKGAAEVPQGTRLGSISSKEGQSKGPCDGVVTYHGIVQ